MQNYNVGGVVRSFAHGMEKTVLHGTDPTGELSVTPLKKGLYAVLAFTALSCMYFAGKYDWNQNDGTIQAIVEYLTTSLDRHAPMSSFDRFTSLIGKKKVPCPTQDARTGVFLLIGQSNVANHARQKHTSDFGEKILNYFDGACYIADSPLLGSTGNGGEPWTLFANKLVRAKDFDTVILVPAGLDGTCLSRWKKGGDAHAILLVLISAAIRNYRITHILWHQGECDFVSGTDENKYKEMFASMLSGIREKGVNAPIYVSVSTKCVDQSAWNFDNPVARAQKSLLNSAPGILPGVDSDLILGERDRYDGCHLSATGQEKIADAWIDAIMLPGNISAIQ